MSIDAATPWAKISEISFQDEADDPIVISTIMRKRKQSIESFSFSNEKGSAERQPISARVHDPYFTEQKPKDKNQGDIQVSPQVKSQNQEKLFNDWNKIPSSLKSYRK